MKNAVSRLVLAAESNKAEFEYQTAREDEVTKWVAKLGSAVAPYLVAVLSGDPDHDPVNGLTTNFDLVQVMVAHTLCRIYESANFRSCTRLHAYGVRSTNAFNSSVKVYWVKRVAGAGR